MKKYVNPTLDLIELEEADIVRTSITRPDREDPNETPVVQLIYY